MKPRNKKEEDDEDYSQHSNNKVSLIQICFYSKG